MKPKSTIRPVLYIILFLTSLHSIQLTAQNPANTKEIALKNKLWNESFKERDTTRLFSLFEPKSIIISESGQWSGKAKIKNILLKLFENRPDIEMTFDSNKIEVG